MDHALPLEGQRLGEDGRRVHGVGEVNRAIERAPFPHAHHLCHHFHQPTVAPVGIAHQRAVPLQHARSDDGIVRAAHGVQPQLQFPDARLAGAQPGKERRVFGVVVQAVGSETQDHGGLTF